MKLCIPARSDEGLKASVSEHFGGAPYFAIVDTANGSCSVVTNHNEHHSHGMCHPLRALQGLEIDAVACPAIGAGAIGKLAAAGIKVYRADGATVADIAAAGKDGSLAEITAADTCARHGCH